MMKRHDFTGFLSAPALVVPVVLSTAAGADSGEAFLRANDPQTGRLTSLRRADDTNRVSKIHLPVAPAQINNVEIQAAQKTPYL
jgi:hypothetical protein